MARMFCLQLVSQDRRLPRHLVLGQHRVRDLLPDLPQHRVRHLGLRLRVRQRQNHTTT